jgi:hypothetical protein
LAPGFRAQSLAVPRLVGKAVLRSCPWQSPRAVPYRYSYITGSPLPSPNQTSAQGNSCSPGMARERDPIARVASRRMEAAESARVCARKSVLWNHGKAPSYPLTAHRGRKGNAATPGRRDCHFERRSPWKSLGPHSPGGGAVPRERGRQSLSASLHSATFLFWQSPRHPRYQRAQPLSTNQMPQTAIEHTNMGFPP